MYSKAREVTPLPEFTLLYDTLGHFTGKCVQISPCQGK